MKITDLERKVLVALFESSEGNGHDFGCSEDARECVANARQLSGIMASLAKKGILTVYDTVRTDSGLWTQFVFKDVEAVKSLIGEK